MSTSHVHKYFQIILNRVYLGRERCLSTGWDFLVVATDGVWDAMSNAEILKYISSRLENKNR